MPWVAEMNEDKGRLLHTTFFPDLEREDASQVDDSYVSTISGCQECLPKCGAGLVGPQHEKQDGSEGIHQLDHA